MSKNINVKLTFSADTKAAQQQINQLQQTLSNIAATPVSGSGLKATAQEIQVATNKALELKVALNNATNVNTGKLNFNKFSQELKRNKTTLQEYAMQLQKLGPQGVQAFSQMATAIRQSETPLVAMQGKLAALGQTFMNTVKWSISSSMIQGVTRAFSSTIDYAKELNESLTNIRIVTGKSMEDVSKFAIEANEAAKALSATTDEYAKASLIYFQQGLNDSAVAERTETTLKLAKVVGESAETTSEWMTAIWNNFDDGSRGLENYADVLAKLGAATASSADEIAGGLEKFAAVAETVGLSYEYAASALATITAETRQSEDVVGTALKTIFARVENLKLGETLEDGTTLGQYSEALAKVGVDIKDSNGQLKEMDDILSSIGTTWQILDRDQQVALAQQVAGIRQYSQFMSLMDNWDVMEKNVELAKEANGALEDQHEIWETGIEGATSRVKEELNEIKNNLLGENDLLPLLNIAEGFLDFVGDLVDSLGGLPGLLSIIASVGLKLWGPQAAAGLTSMINGVKSLYGVASGKTHENQKEMVKEASGLEANMKANMGSGERGMLDSDIAKKEANLTNLIMENEQNISADKKQQIEFERQLLQIQEKRLQNIADEHDAAQSGADKARRKLEIMDVDNDDVDRLERAAVNTATLNKGATSLENTEFSVENLESISQQGNNLVNQVENSGSMDPADLDALKASRDELVKSTKGYGETVSKLTVQENELKDAEAKVVELEAEATKNGQKTNKELANARRAYTNKKKAVEGTRKELDGYKESIKSSQTNIGKAVKGVNEYGKTLDELKDKYGEAREELENFGDNMLEATTKNIELKEGQEDLGESFKNTEKNVEDAAKAGQGWTTTFINGMQGVASAAAGLQMLHGAIGSLSDAMADGTAGFSDYLSAITSILFALPMMVNGLKTINSTFKISSGLSKLFAKLEKKRANDAIPNAVKHKIAGEIESSTAKTTMLAKLGKLIVSNWAMAIAAVAALAGLGLLTYNLAQAKKEEKQQEETDNKAIETAEGALEVAEGWNEESQAMDDLIAKHNELKKANDQTIEGQKALKEAQQAVIDQVPQLIEKYKELDKEYENLDLSGDIAVLEGAAANKDVEQIEQITNRIDQKIAEETSRIAKEGQSGAAGRTLAAIAKQTDDKVKNKTIDWHVGDVGSDIGEKKLAKILGQDFDGEGVNISLDANDPKAFVEQYEKLQQFVKEMEEAGHTSDDTYREVKEGIDAAAESYEKLKTLVEDGTLYEIQDYINQKGIDPSKITSYQQYSNLVEELTGNEELLKIATEEQIRTWIEGQKVLSEFTSLEKKALAYRDKYGYELYDNMLKYAKGLETEEDLEAFLKIDFDKYQVKETWDGLVKYIKKLDKADALQKKVEAITSAEKNLKSNGTRKDYEKLQKSITWGEDGFIKFSTFLGKSYQEQKAYLEGIKIQQADLAQKEYQAALNQLILTKQQTQEKINQLLVEKELTKEQKEQLEHLKVDLQNLNKKIETTKISLELAKLEAKQAREARAKRIRDFKNNKQALEDEYDAYRHINEINEDLSRTMERIANAKEQAYGKEYISLLNQEIHGLEIENDLLDKTIKLANKRAAAHKEELASSYGATLDSFGNISNYNAIQASYLQDLAKLEAGSGKDSEAYKNKKEEYDDFIKLAEDYNEDLEKSEDAIDQKASNMREILDKKLEGIEYVINIKLEVNQHELNILKRQLTRLNDDAYDSAARIVNMTQQTEKNFNELEINTEGIRNVLTTAGVSSEDIEQYITGNGEVIGKYNLSETAMNNLTSYTNGAIENLEEIENLGQSIKDEFMITFDAWHEKIDDIGAAIEAQGSLIKSYQNIVDIMGKDKLGLDDTILKSLEEANNITVKTSLENAKTQKETTEAALLNAQVQKKLYAEGSEMYKYWADQEMILSKQLDEDTQNFMSAWENALTVAYETFETETKRAIDNLGDYMAGANFDSMDELSKNFEWQQEVSDRYLENYEKAYELSKLNRKIQKDIDSTDNVRAQKIMRDMQVEIAEKQKDGVKLSQHDLEILQKKYDLKLAEIALEEAQDAKSIVRLQRDSEGNFGYVYTADQSAVDNAEQNYEDKLYAMQKSNDEYIESLSKQIIDNRKAMQEEIAAIDITEYASKEEYLNAVQEITIRYQEKENYLLGEIQKTISSNQDVYNNDVLAYGSFVDQQENISQTWVTEFGNTAFAIITGFENIEDAQENLNTAIGDPNAGTGLLGQLDNAYDNLDSNINNAMSTAGSNVTNFGKTIKMALYGEDGNGGAIGNIKDLESKSKDYAKTAKEKFEQNATNINNWYKIFGKKIKDGKEDVDNLEEALGKLKDVYITVDTKVDGENEIEDLTDAIGKLKKAIETLQGADFKISADIKIDPGTTYNSGEDDKNHGKDIYSGSYSTDYKIQATGTDSQGYAMVKVNGKWYNSRSVNNGQGKVGDIATFINEYSYLNPLNQNNLPKTIDLNNATFDVKNSKYINLYDKDGNNTKAMSVDNSTLGSLKMLKIDGYKEKNGTHLYHLSSGWSVDLGTKTYWLNQTDLHQILNKVNEPALYNFYNLKKYDTGGYTGNWGPEGRLAMLHQKEIVLNAHDTENFLTAIQIVRSMADKLEANALMTSQGLGSVFAATVNPTGDTLEQNVTIHAEFPNATNRNEIEEAFKSLVNSASQYANRKR